MAIRTFLALDLDEAIRRRLAAAAGDVPPDALHARRVAPENLHVTVKFLGDVAEADAPAVCRAVAEAAGKVAAFEFDVRGLRCVPPGRGARMIWGGVDEPTGRMAAMFEQLEAALEPRGFPREGRRFQPHVTLARIKSVRDPAALKAATDARAAEHFGAQRADQVTVYRSELTPRGPIYTAMAHAPLGGGSRG
ncbi:MAG TPA: RNA 2',3'-cyclic phosphodiesterase [Phycisphaerae bacterium]|nr:RNA 2',3'-cyclic phosphodiesterase [Phycisphaerae bacterium]